MLKFSEQRPYIRQNQVEESDEHGENDRKHEDYGSRVHQFFASGPVHPPQLATYLNYEVSRFLQHPRLVASLSLPSALVRVVTLAGLAGLEPATPGFGDRCSAS